VIDGEVRALEGFVWKIPTLSLGVAETGGSG
jgi:hypothetical protein